MENKNLEIETRTIEQLLQDLRESKNWTYNNMVSELTKLGLIIDAKKVKKWEFGLDYPNMDEIYKLSELYFIPSDNFIMAKNNSYKEGLNSVHMTIIKFLCYISGISFKLAWFIIYSFLFIATLGSLFFFISKANEFLGTG